MSKSPSLQFYPGDWQRDTGLKMCSLAARGLWIEMMWLMFDGEPFGHLSVKGSVIPPVKLGVILGVEPSVVESLLCELEQYGIFSRTDTGMIYSRRMVRDHKRRETNSLNGKQGGNPNLKSDNPPVRKSVNRKVNRNSADADAVEVPLSRKSEKERAHEAEVEPTFNQWWTLYAKSRDKEACRAKWIALGHNVHEKIMEHTAAYVRAQPDKVYRKDPIRYLQKQGWTDEVISSTATGNKTMTDEQYRESVKQAAFERFGGR